MSQDLAIFVIAGILVFALVLVGPGYVIWQYQRGGLPAVHSNPADSPESDPT
ncbi:hypothetical protein [Mycobacterium paraterrae]|uniref:Uncharacterized protein n=1 Tax=Mycobacterium paraterrae TaxID=577492 RepID=A0ABY3VWH6_9MYCO|nr:hypothetical protein [Mycobacterium paraterrae]UMB71847.1 hypothetical protein MKK62_11860 [Mycobacterium paraterrae]